MKRHTYKNKNILGILLILTMVLVGVSMGMRNTSATKDNNTSQELQFNFEKSIRIDLPTDDPETGWEGGNHTTKLEIDPGTTKEGEVTGPIKVSSTSGSGFYLTATVGEKGGDGYLNLDERSDDHRIAILGVDENIADLSTKGINESVWGIRFATGDGEVADGNVKSANFTGLPLDNADDGATGKPLITATSQGVKSLKYQVGVKAGATLQPGTYQNVIHFYAVTKDS